MNRWSRSSAKPRPSLRRACVDSAFVTPRASAAPRRHERIGRPVTRAPGRPLRRDPKSPGHHPDPGVDRHRRGRDGSRVTCPPGGSWPASAAEPAFRGSSRESGVRPRPGCRTRRAAGQQVAKIPLGRLGRPVGWEDRARRSTVGPVVILGHPRQIPSFWDCRNGNSYYSNLVSGPFAHPCPSVHPERAPTAALHKPRTACGPLRKDEP
jgi:hypothetical protein